MSQLPSELADWVPGSGALQIEPVHGGLVNRIFRLRRAQGESYSVRIAGERSAELGVERAWECRVRRAAGAAGIAPRVLRCEPQTGLLLGAWVEGRVWSALDARAPAQLLRLAELLRRVHQLQPEPPLRRMAPADWCAYYGDRLGAVRDPWRGTAARVLAAYGRLPATIALCHSDAHHLNVVDDGRLWLLDWEYAHIGDPHWDLAAWIGNHDLAPPLQGILIESYLGRVASFEEAERIRHLLWLFDYVCWLWCRLAGQAQRALVLAGRLER
jgi:thiamine kinase-like enzyme